MMFETTKSGEIKGMKPGERRRAISWRRPIPTSRFTTIFAGAGEGTAFNDAGTKWSAKSGACSPPAGRPTLCTKLIQQQPSFANHAKLYGEAQGLERDGNNKRRPVQRAELADDVAVELRRRADQPGDAGCFNRLNSMASSIGGWQNELSKFAEAHPDAAKVTGGGALAAGASWRRGDLQPVLRDLMSGFGLGRISDRPGRFCGRSVGCGGRTVGGRRGECRNQSGEEGGAGGWRGLAWQVRRRRAHASAQGSCRPPHRWEGLPLASIICRRGAMAITRSDRRAPSKRWARPCRTRSTRSTQTSRNSSAARAK